MLSCCEEDDCNLGKFVSLDVGDWKEKQVASLAIKFVDRSEILTAHIAAVFNSCLSLYAHRWSVWRLFITTTKQNQQHIGARLDNTMLTDLNPLQAGDPLMSESSLEQSVLTLPVVHYLLQHCTLEKRMWNSEPRSRPAQIAEVLFPQNTDSTLLIALWSTCKDSNTSLVLKPTKLNTVFLQLSLHLFVCLLSVLCWMPYSDSAPPALCK